MVTDAEIERALAAINATLNDQQPEHFDRDRVQEIVTGALGEEQHVAVDGGGGLHDEDGRRLGAVRKLPDGSWHVERQNYEAQAASTEIPTPSKMSGFRKLLTKLKMKAS